MFLSAPYKTDLANDMQDHIERLWLHTGKWKGPRHLHPLYDPQKDIESAPITRHTFDSQYAGQNIKSIEAHSTLDTAGIYMPNINLHLGFDHVANMARDNLKRELVKTERKPLFNAYVKACNKYQLVCLPNQAAAPFEVCAGSVWENTGGCINRFCRAVEKALGRQLTRKEGIFVKAQWPALTEVKRARIRDQSHTNVLKDNQTIYTTEGKKINQKLHSLLNAVHGYSGAVAKLRKMLASGAIDHDFYTDCLATLRKNRDLALEILHDEGYQDTRQAYGSGRVMSNAAGVAPSAAASKRYALDGYTVDEHEARNLVPPKPPKTEDQRALEAPHKK